MQHDKKGWDKLRTSLDKKRLARHVRRTENLSRKHLRKHVGDRIENVRLARRPIIIWMVLIGVLIIASASQFFVARDNYVTEASAAGGTYAEGVVGKIDSLNPLYAASSAETSISKLLFSTLYQYDNKGALSGDLATGMSVDPTGKIFTVKITKNAMWHDNTELTAKDVVFTVALIKNPEVRSPLRSSWQDVQVRALDDYTIEFRLPAVYAAFQHALTFPILPRHILSEVSPSTVRQSDFSMRPVGSGPFSFKLLQNTDALHNHKSVQMAVHLQYHKGAPKISRFELHAYQNAADLLNGLKVNEIGGAADVSNVDAGEINAKTYDVQKHPVNSGVYLLFNMNNATLKDANIRKALQLATDVAAVRKSLGVEKSELNSPFIPGQIPGADTPVVPATNVAQAKQMLDSAGWKLNTKGILEKGGAPLKITITTTKDPDFERALSEVRKQWAAIGVDVVGNVVDTTQPNSNFVQETLQLRNFEVLLYELLVGADPDVYAYWHSSQANQNGYNFVNYSNKIADASLSSARSRIEKDLRVVKYKAFARDWVNDMPAVPLYRQTAVYAANRMVNSVQPGAVFSAPVDRYADIIHWSVNEEAVYKTP